MNLKPKLILFGASKLGEEAYNFLKWDYDILFFCDNSVEKHEKNFCGCKVIMPNELNDINMDDVDLVITSTYSNEIFKQLYDMGYDNAKIYNRDYSYKRLNIDGLFCNTLYYDKNITYKHKLISQENVSKLSKVLFIQQESFNNSFELSIILKKKEIVCDVLLVENNSNNHNAIGNKLEKYFKNIYNTYDNDLKEIKLNNYDLAIVCCNEIEIRKLVDEIDIPIIEYVQNKKYLKDGVFFHSYVHDILNEISSFRDDDRIYDYKIQKYMKIRDTEKSITLPIKYNTLSEDNNVLEEYTKYGDKTGEIHCVLIDNDGIIKQDYAMEKINQIINEKIHIHIYSYNDNIKIIDINSQYIHFHNMLTGKEMAREIKKYDYAISQYLLKEDKFFISDIIDNNLSKYLIANLPVLIDKAVTSEGKIQKHGNYYGLVYVDLKKKINRQLKILKSENKYENKVNSEYLFLDFYIEEIISFLLKVKKNYYTNNNTKYVKELYRNKIALRIVTKNRSDNIKRDITFYLTMKNIQVKLYIIDGSEGLEKLATKKLVKEYNNTKIKHITFEKDPGAYERIYWTKEIEEDLFFNVADDDFFTERSLESAVKFLDKNNDFGAVAGIETYYSKNYFNNMEMVKNVVKILEEEDNILRVSEFYSQTNTQKFGAHNIYSCFRKEVFEKIYSILNIQEYFKLKLFWQEYFGYLITCYVTKIKYLDTIINIREKNECHKKEYALMIKDNIENIVKDNEICLDIFKDDLYYMQIILKKENIHIDLERAMKEYIKVVIYSLGISLN